MMMAQVLFFDIFAEKDPHLNAVEIVSITKTLMMGVKLMRETDIRKYSHKK